jgi:hypothetical protein
MTTGATSGTSPEVAPFRRRCHAADFGRYARRVYERRWLLRDFPAQLDLGRPCSRITDSLPRRHALSRAGAIRTSDNDIV